MTLIQRPGGDSPNNLPVLTQIVDKDVPDDLPTLTEIVAERQTEPAAPGPDNEQILLRKLESHLEEVFAHKLGLSLERLQRQAIEQAVNELKAELPALLHDALKARAGL